MRKKAVCISCFHYYTQRVRLIMEYLRGQGYDCTYITSDFDHIEKKRFRLEIPDAIQIPTKPYYKNLSVARLSSHARFAKNAFAIVERLQPELLFVMIPPNSMAKQASMYKKEHPEVRLILDLYDLWPETFPSSSAKKLLALPFSMWRNIRDRGLSAADFITTECELYQQVLKKQLADKPTDVLYLCRPGITVQGDLTAPQAQELNLCYLGSINNIIDIPTIVALLREISSIRPVKLHIIGDGESRSELITAAEDAGAQVKYHGKVYDNIKKQKIFDACSFGINVMKSAVCVGLTMKSLDYFAGGLPILNTIGGDTHELVEHRGIGLNVCREDLRRTAVEVTKLLPEENLRMRQNTLDMFNELFSEEAFWNKLYFLKQFLIDR